MKYLIDVSESCFQTNTYLVEAKSEDAARKNLLDGSGEGTVELVSSYNDTSEIKKVLSLKPYTE
jgi:hypothetical protein